MVVTVLSARCFCQQQLYCIDVFNDQLYRIAGVFEGGFHEFHKSIALCKNITLEMFTKNIITKCS